MKVLSLAVCFLCVNFLMASESYRAGVVRSQVDKDRDLTALLRGKGIDILILPLTSESTEFDNYDKVVSEVSDLARQAGAYVVAHLHEKVARQLGHETVRSNLVFDRKGDIVAVYRKRQNTESNCTGTSSGLVTFSTDFGTTFGVLMEEDLALYDDEHLRGVKNFVMVGEGQADVSFVKAAQFAPSWSYVINANLVSTSGIFAGKAGLKSGIDILAVADLHKNGVYDGPVVPSINPTVKFIEDLGQYVLKPLDLESSSHGYKETLCHRGFCCEYYIKTGSKGAKPEVSYSIAAYNGVRPLSANYNIGTQICLISGSENSEIIFERISITANYTIQNAQYPIVQTKSKLPAEHFKFSTNVNGVPQQVTLEIVDGQGLMNVGVFGKDTVNNLESNYGFAENKTEVVNNEIYDYIFNEDVQEFFDYVWIRFRVLLVVVSIYILEMM